MIIVDPIRPGLQVCVCACLYIEVHHCDSHHINKHTRSCHALNKRNPVTFPNTPQHARAHYCSTERHTRSFSKTLLGTRSCGYSGPCSLLYKPSSCFNTTSAFWFCLNSIIFCRTLLGSLPLANNGHHSASYTTQEVNSLCVLLEE